MMTSSGTASVSIRWRTKSKSVCEAEGKATSISLKPTRTSASNMRRLRSPFIGSISAWFPSRRSELHHTGTRVIAREGQVRSGSAIGGKARYFLVGSFNIVVLLGMRQPGSHDAQRDEALLGGAAA